MRLPAFLRRSRPSPNEEWNGYPESRLKDIILFLTDRCNMRCDHCMFWQRIDAPGAEMAVEELQRIALSAPPLRTAAMTGGEPFLRNDLAKIVEIFFRDNHTHHIQINTNGLLLERMEELAQRDLAARYQRHLTFQISLDGMEETHERLRRAPGSFKKIVRNAKRLADMAKEHPYFHAVILTNINKENYHEIEAIADYIREIAGIAHAFDLVRGAGFSAWNVPEDILEKDNPRDCGLPPLEALDSIVGTVKRIYARDGADFGPFMRQMEIQAALYLNKPTPYRCLTAGRTIGAIYSDGAVAACEFTKPFAHLADYDFDLGRLWNSPKAEQRRREITGCVCCHTCFVLTSLQEWEERRAAKRS